MAATRGSSALSTATPSAGSASTISPLASAMFSCEPNSPMWALPTLRTREMSGGAMAHSALRWPTPRAPISSTRYRVLSSIRSTVSGRPSSLLNEPAVATVGAPSASSRASMSLTDVLPWEPVIATTVIGARGVAAPAQHLVGQRLQGRLGVGAPPRSGRRSAARPAPRPRRRRRRSRRTRGRRPVRPRRRRTAHPGSGERLSRKAGPVTTRVGSASTTSPPTMSATSASDSGIIDGP